MSKHPGPRPRGDTDAVKGMARDLAKVAAQIATFKGEANAYLGDPGYGALRTGLEMAHAAVEWPPWSRSCAGVCRKGGAGRVAGHP